MSFALAVVYIHMIASITVNLPVKDLARSSAFLTQLGFTVSPLFASEPEMELVILSAEVSVMLLSESRFQSITGKVVVDTTRHAEAILQLRVEGRQRVDDLVDRALSAGGLPLHPPNDQAFVYGRSFQDLDRHNWDVFWVDERR